MRRTPSAAGVVREEKEEGEEVVCRQDTGLSGWGVNHSWECLSFLIGYLSDDNRGGTPGSPQLQGHGCMTGTSSRGRGFWRAVPGGGTGIARCAVTRPSTSASSGSTAGTSSR